MDRDYGTVDLADLVVDQFGMKHRGVIPPDNYRRDMT